MSRKPIVGGNWKMNTTLATGADLARGVIEQAGALTGDVDVAFFVPFPYLTGIGSTLQDTGSGIALGSQDVYFEEKGAFTGEVSTSMLQDCGVKTVLAGHSERRHVIGETDELVNKKVLATLAAGMESVLCVGETLEQREAGETDAVNEKQARAGLEGVSDGQFARVTIAYEPVWAIGTGKTATPEDAQAAHEKIRAVLADLYSEDLAQACRIQYGGSVKPGNAAELFGQPDIDGGLIGGASLKADDFSAIIKAAAESKK
ncbi:MAG: triose-phosphate isomerase [Planctomycetota bacterium]